MKTLEKRAQINSNRFTYNVKRYDKESLHLGYVDGANEQNRIDVDMACEWLRARNVLTEASIEGFRKMMKELV